MQTINCILMCLKKQICFSPDKNSSLFPHNKDGRQKSKFMPETPLKRLVNNVVILFFQICQHGRSVQRVRICGADWCCQYCHGWTFGTKGWKSAQEVQRAGEQLKNPVDVNIIRFKCYTHFISHHLSKPPACWHSFMWALPFLNLM